MKLFDKIFKSDKPVEPMDLTTIIRTEVLEGFSVPGIIHNMQYHFIDLQVYSDGLISCWEMVDLPMFKEKLNSNWVVPSIPNGQALSIFSLGNWYIEKGEWQHTKETLFDHISSLVKRLNPTLENLYNYNGNNSKTVGKTNVAKHYIPNPKPYYYDDPNAFFPKKIDGEKFHIFFRNDDSKTYLAELSIFKSGRIEITNIPSKKIFLVEDLEKLAKEGQITSDLKIGEVIHILGLGSITIKSGQGVDINLKLKEFMGKFDELNGNENSIQKCARIFDEYKKTPTKKLKTELESAYEAVPEHQRIFVGTMDTKDYEVRQILYGDIVKKEWQEHYGFEYPYADMPKPVDE